MTVDHASFRNEVLASFQRALWDLVTPSLRAVAVRPSYPLIEARFLFESVGQVEHEVVAEAEAHVIADFLPPVDVRFIPVQVAPSEGRALLDGEEWVYRRQEGDST